ncbi:hypothetical protein BTN49_3098 [Candidatus Enterovibrio escicola]|uniref:Uncharacterized protein n=1 Tax=Candidatus Enterovibrio escicola TaxID=1927127 RepID=A0A2A5T060_9GAMM|nr:hypothetical protein BTN49_3098 [Candidatus Enterovibrio escacola]
MVAHIIINDTGLKVYGESKGKLANTVRRSGVSGANFILPLMCLLMRLLLQQLV